jgi:hypothetical protein
MSDHPSTFMKIIKGRSNAISDAKDERRQVLFPCVIWDGSIDLFKILRKVLKVTMEKLMYDTYLTQNSRMHT